MTPADWLLARAQVALAFLFSLGFIASLLLLLFFKSTLSGESLTIITNMLTVFGTLLTMQMQYFFSRQRPPTLPDPNSTTITTPTPPTPGTTNVAVSTQPSSDLKSAPTAGTLTGTTHP